MKKSRRYKSLRGPIAAHVEQMESKTLLSHSGGREILVQEDSDFLPQTQGSIDVALQTFATIESTLFPGTSADAFGSVTGTVVGNVWYMDVTSGVGLETKVRREGVGSHFGATTDVLVVVSGEYDLTFTADVALNDVQKTQTNGGETVGADVSAYAQLQGSGYLYVWMSTWATHEEITQGNASMATTKAHATLFVSGAKIDNVVGSFSQGTVIIGNLATSKYAATDFGGDLWGSGVVHLTSESGLTDASGSDVPAAQDGSYAKNSVLARGLVSVNGHETTQIQDDEESKITDELFSVAPASRTDAKWNLFSVALKPAAWDGILAAITKRWKDIFLTV
ncbi:MAG TPA: hypothetical protein VJI96_03550 [Candidatus Andersenbacteria bacterium]|nr:hypothetical protein [Candidatus Andersenbacteria bacterium]